MSNFEKIVVIFVTGLVAVILAMSFFGSGQEPRPSDVARADESRGAGDRPSSRWREVLSGESREEEAPADAAGSRWSPVPSAGAPSEETASSAPASEPASAWGRNVASVPPPEGSSPQDPSRRESSPVGPTPPRPSGGSLDELWKETVEEPPVGASVDGLASRTPASGAPEAAPPEPRRIPERPELTAAPGESPRTIAVQATYTIREGDSLSEIAARTLGTAKAWKRIVAANPGLDPRRLPIGTVLRIPHGSGPVAADDGTAAQARYTIRKGDSLSEIAARTLGTAKAWKRIVAANPGLDPGRLPVGRVLRIPGGGAAPDGAGPRRDRAPSVDDRLHTVADGETLSEIALAKLDDAGRWREIYELNRDRVPGPDRVPVGARLRLPE